MITSQNYKTLAMVCGAHGDLCFIFSPTVAESGDAVEELRLMESHHT